MTSLYNVYSVVLSKFYWRPVRGQEAQPQKHQEQDSLEETSATKNAAAAAAAFTILEETSATKKTAATAATITEEKCASNKTVVATIMEEIVPHPRLTCFLEKDNSFLSPWSWDPKALVNEVSSSSQETKQYFRFQPESYFVREVFDFIKS